MSNLTTKCLTYLMMGLLPLTVVAAPLTEKDRMKADLDIIRNVVNTQYAPADWKAMEFGWSIDDEISNAYARIDSMQNITNKNFRLILKDLFNSFKDYHVSVLFHTTEMAFLPFRVKGAQGRYFVIYIEDGEDLPFAVGDEITKFDGKPIAEVINKLKLEKTPNDNVGTDNAFAETALTERIGAEGVTVPRGQVSIEGISAKTKKSKKAVLQWEYYPERIKQFVKQTPSSPEEKISPANQLAKTLMESKRKIYPKYKHNKKIIAQHRKDDPTELGGAVSYVPDLGKIIWRSKPSDCQFPAYIYLNAKGKSIGYIRIPEYDEGAYPLKDFEVLIDFFQDNTDALVIDQINNPGGSVFYTYSLLSKLTTKPMLTPLDREAITHKEVGEAVSILELFDDYQRYALSVLFDEDEFDFLKDDKMMAQVVDYFEGIIDSWESGILLTEPHALLGIDKIMPDRNVNYSKPILVLINEMDISCGDMFPAILQDAKRAKLFGTRTAGASGLVNFFEFPNLSGIDGFSFTGSISERPDGTPIENVGISPDIEYSLTPNDLQNGFKDYKDAINAAVNSLL